MNGLTSKQRNRLPKGRFGLPQERKYPLTDEAHARSALALAARFATPQQRSEIEQNVRRLFPAIHIGQ